MKKSHKRKTSRKDAPKKQPYENQRENQQNKHVEIKYKVVCACCRYFRSNSEQSWCTLTPFPAAKHNDRACEYFQVKK